MSLTEEDKKIIEQINKEDRDSSRSDNGATSGSLTAWVDIAADRICYWVVGWRQSARAVDRETYLAVLETIKAQTLESIDDHLLCLKETFDVDIDDSLGQALQHGALSVGYGD